MNKFQDDENLMSLDFNNIHNSKRVSRQQRNSVYQILNQLKNQNISSWATKIVIPENKMYSYPANLDQAIIHQQSCYLQPEENFLKKNQNIDQCQCCGQQIRRRRVNFFTVNLYEYLVEQYGLSLPLYFSLLKLHTILLTLVFLVYGIYFFYVTNHICMKVGQYNDTLHFVENPDEIDDSHVVWKDTCHKMGPFYIVPQRDIFQAINSQQLEKEYHIYLILGYIVYLIIMLSPFIHEVFIRAKQITYWNFEILNHIQFEKQSVYVKHLPKKMTEQEIQKSIFQALLKTNPQSAKKSMQRLKILSFSKRLFTPEINAIEELVYIYDIHPIKEMNQVRQNTFLKLLMLANDIRQLISEIELKNLKESKQLKKKEDRLEVLRTDFVQQVFQLMIQTKKIQQYLKAGLPYTNKIILKFFDEEQTEAVYSHFKKGFIEAIKSRLRVLWSERKGYNYKSINEFTDGLTDSLLSDYPTSRSSSEKKQSIHDLSDAAKSKSNSIDESSVNQYEQKDVIVSSKKKTLNEIIQGDAIIVDEINRLREQKLLDEQESQKDIHISRGYREDEIYWENIGMNTLKRFLLRLVTLIYQIIAGIITMGLFEYLFFYQHNNNIRDKQDIEHSNSKLRKVFHEVYSFFFIYNSKIISELITIVIVCTAVISSLITIRQTIKSHRSTYTLQEKNIIIFMNLTQQFFIISVGFIMVISLWGGKHNLIAVIVLMMLTITRIILKGTAEILHIRSSTFWCRKKKIINKFNAYQYFQLQLNQLMTPSYFPNRLDNYCQYLFRSRLFYTFFCFSSGLLMIYIAPIVILFCLLFQIIIFYYDKYSLLHVFTIDKKFNFTHIKFTVVWQKNILYSIYIAIKQQ